MAVVAQPKGAFARLLLVPFILALSPTAANAADWRLGLAAGIGSSNISVAPDTATESPLVFKAWAELPLSFDKTLLLEHTRSFKPSTLSSGITFTGVAGLWYPWGSYPQRTIRGDDAFQNGWSQKRIAPFLGLGTGLASGDALDSTGASSLTLSGYSFYVSARGGADYPISEKFYLRTQVEVDFSIAGASIGSTALQLGALWYL